MWYPECVGHPGCLLLVVDHHHFSKEDLVTYSHSDAVKNTRMYAHKPGQTLHQMDYRWGTKRACSALWRRQSQDRRRPSFLQGRTSYASSRWALFLHCLVFLCVNPSVDMLGFKLSNSARENGAAQKTRPIYLDMQVGKRRGGRASVTYSSYPGHYSC